MCSRIRDFDEFVPLFVTQSNAVMPVDNYMGKVTGKNNNVLTVHYEYKADYSDPPNWVSYSTTSPWTVSNSDGINEIGFGDYIEIAGYLGVGSEGDSVCIGKMKSSTEKVITDVYGDPDYLVPVSVFMRDHPEVLNPPLLGNYIRASGSRPIPSPLINQFTIFTPFSDNFCYSYLKPFCTHLR